MTVIIQAEMTEEQLEVLVSEVQEVFEMIGINPFEYRIYLNGPSE